MMQQSYAKLCGVAETVEVAALVEDSLRLERGRFRAPRRAARDANSGRFRRSPSTSTRCCRFWSIWCATPSTPATNPGVRTSRSRCASSARLGACASRSSTTAWASRAENMQRLFRHGFTTRESGHGFGLHSGALAAQELGGTLHAESAGSGLGARVHPRAAARARRGADRLKAWASELADCPMSMPTSPARLPAPSLQASGYICSSGTSPRKQLLCTSCQ